MMFETICRICLFKTDRDLLVPIFNLADCKYPLQLFHEMRIFENDQLPQNACEKCITSLKLCIDLQKRCEESYNLLCGMQIKEKVEAVKIENSDFQLEIPLEYSSDEDDKALSKVFSISNDKNNKCNNCSFSTKSQRALKNHVLKEHTQVKFKRLKCDLCKKSYITEESLRQHKQKHFLPSGELEKPSKLSCNQCSQMLDTKKELISHVKESHRKDMRKRLCEICNKVLANKFSYRTHLQHHRGERPYVCETCGQKFSQPGSLKTHKLIHEGVLPFQCPQCPYRARLKRSLQMHMVVHTGERAYACHLCPKAYTSGTNLHKHIRTHDPSTRYQCEHCDKAFTVRTNLLDHIASVHLGTKRHRCDICGERFSSNSTLNRHRHDVHKVKKHPNIRKGKLPDYLKMQINMEGT